MPAHQRSLYALGVAFATYGLTVLPPHGNGFIAVFVCAIVLGIRRPDIRDCFDAAHARTSSRSSSSASSSCSARC